MANKPLRKIASFKNTLIHLQLPIFLLLPEFIPYMEKLTSSATCNIEPIHQGASYVCSQSRAQLSCENTEKRGEILICIMHKEFTWYTASTTM
jgi:hypothetical protein